MVLTDAKFSNADIMSVSGHKSVQSLATYQKTDNKKKIEMGKALFDSMNKDTNKQLKAPQEKLALPAPESTKQLVVESEVAVTPRAIMDAHAVIPYEPTFDDDIPDFDLLNAICEMEQNNTPQIPVTMSASVANTSHVVNQIPKALFANCHIGTINLNIVKK